MLFLVYTTVLFLKKREAYLRTQITLSESGVKKKLLSKIENKNCIKLQEYVNAEFVQRGTGVNIFTQPGPNPSFQARFQNPSIQHNCEK